MPACQERSLLNAGLQWRHGDESNGTLRPGSGRSSPSYRNADRCTEPGALRATGRTTGRVLRRSDRAIRAAPGLESGHSP